MSECQCWTATATAAIIAMILNYTRLAHNRLTYSLTHSLTSLLKSSVHLCISFPICRWLRPSPCFVLPWPLRLKRKGTITRLHLTLLFSSSLHTSAWMDSGGQCMAAPAELLLSERREYLIRWSHTSGGNDVKLSRRIVSCC